MSDKDCFPEIFLNGKRGLSMSILETESLEDPWKEAQRLSAICDELYAQRNALKEENKELRQKIRSFYEVPKPTKTIKEEVYSRLDKNPTMSEEKLVKLLSDYNKGTVKKYYRDYQSHILLNGEKSIILNKLEADLERKKSEQSKIETDIHDIYVLIERANQLPEENTATTTLKPSKLKVEENDFTKFLMKLSDDHFNTLVLRFNLAGLGPKTFKEIGAFLGVSSSRASHLYHEATGWKGVDKLRKQFPEEIDALKNNKPLLIQYKELLTHSYLGYYLKDTEEKNLVGLNAN